MIKNANLFWTFFGYHQASLSPPKISENYHFLLILSVYAYGKRRHVNQLVDLNFKSVPTEKTFGMQNLLDFFLRFVCANFKDFLSSPAKNRGEVFFFRFLINQSRLSASSCARKCNKAARSRAIYSGYLMIHSHFSNVIFEVVFFAKLYERFLGEFQCHFNRNYKKLNFSSK
jgi:hypothetical protein